MLQPSLFDHTARNAWVQERFETYRKSSHAASQARSQGAKCRQWAHDATLQGDLTVLRDLQREAEAHYQRAETLEREAQQALMDVTQKVVL